jgi:hypothetical protein
MENHIQVGFGWGTLSLIIAGIAQGKNRSGFAWWLLGLILGPIALVILLFLSKVPDLGVIEARIAT